MAYDFHIDLNNQAKLIEVNTQASGYLISDLVDQVHHSLSPDTYSKTNNLLLLKKSFEEEWKSFSGKNTPPSHTLIVDDQIPKQKMYIEFLMFKDLLSKWLYTCQLEEITNLNLSREGFVTDSHQKKAEMIYNRSTDFYLQKNPALKQAFLNQKTLISPNPTAYLLLADKARLVDWASSDFLNSLTLTETEKSLIQRALPQTEFIHTYPTEKLWKQKKHWFFKPLRGYGGKAVYRGKNLSRKMFERIIQKPYLLQENIPPPIYTDPFRSSMEIRHKSLCV